ncbi:2-C-methyl-D-erythritol 4-phosphate cytidylyltransferase [Butyrivibrio proteoclasticus]|uniref:Ribitol-5-phosphate cytidylyltransferase n=1 Tax=Butyrivibrio proteoclasticus TaxID=43305 RepID=A0A1I5TB88_9FIRM|nr:IspD/TarI family cytidylyltransferase [Butyrivibrio proteoclasticus]SFP80238.1 2-C-methyl-D-erythritol 4-phosphate cytidylyltransferase [Butyrivibrio proteoclasticus]
MNIAVIFAGGVGHRMHTKELPKQFLEVYGKPVIIHTLEKFEQHNEVDAIVIACVKEWIPYLNNLITDYHLQKAKSVVVGGKTGQESIYNGLVAAKAIAYEKAVVLIHDGVRPFITPELISDNIASVKKHGSAITTSKVTETILVVNGESSIDEVPDRNNSRLAKAPQSFYLDDILKAHETARSEKRNDFIDSCSLMQHYGYKLHLVDGPIENIKVTTPQDIFTMRSVFEAREILKMQEQAE